MWRGKRFLKDEGDPNYLSLRRDERVYGGIRDYAEAGLARRFKLAAEAALEVSGRVHRIEGFYEVLLPRAGDRHAALEASLSGGRAR